MASSLDRWEKDPFFPAAEEVQESADRMESTYRTWIHARNDVSSIWNVEELRRDLHTALCTTKWQLEEFERAVNSSYTTTLSDDAKGRHQDFVTAINSQISKTQYSLQESVVSEGKASLPWVRLDEGECNELATFLTGSSHTGDSSSTVSSVDEKSTKSQEMGKNGVHPLYLSELGLGGNNAETFQGHRRAASANADLNSWKISIPNGNYFEGPPKGILEHPPRKVPSFSGFLGTLGIESTQKLKLPKINFRKWKITEHPEKSRASLMQLPPLSKGINTCFQKNKSRLDICDDYDDKHIYGWYGAIQRQLQRSHYQIQYSRTMQVIFWILLLCCLIVLLVMRTI